ncbi:MAG TPA: YkvA family protein [Saprospiraceae bacterium]|nr:YkvA family protein [Saprospiraceae bacterium]
MKVIQRLKLKAKELKSEVQVLIIAYKDKRTPASAKILIGITAGYLLSPIDLIPDFIPVIGLLDDLIIVPFLIKLSLKLIPETVLEDARKEAFNNSRQLKKTNWLFAIIIIFIWLAFIHFVYGQLRHLWT